MAIKFLSSQSITGELTVSTISVIGSDTDKFLMSDGGVIKYVTGATLLSYIGAGTSSTDYYVTSTGFNTSTGALTLVRVGLSTLSQNLDGRYVDLSTNQSVAGVKSFTGKIGADGGIDGLTNANGGVSGSNYNITGVNQLSFNDPGEGLVFNGSTTVYLDTIDDTTDDKLRLRNATQLDLNSQARITNLVDPTSAQDGATKTYVDTAVSGVPQGTVTGSGVNQRVAYWNSASGITSTNGFTFNGNSFYVPNIIYAAGGNSTEWNSAYDDTITLLAVTGVATKTLTATQQDGGTLTASWVPTYVAPATPATPGSLVATIVGETIEIQFNQSSTTDIGYYQVWSSDDGGDYGLIAQITPTDFSATMTVVDTTFTTGGTMSYRVFAVKGGLYSTAGTVSKVYTVGALSVTNMTVINLNTAYYVQYEKPISRFIDHIEIWMDSTTTLGALLRANAILVYSGQNASYMRDVNTSSNYHQFWVEITTT